MPGADVLTGDEVRRRRTASQHLHRPRRLETADLVRHLVGVQAQVLAGAGLALRARSDGLTADLVDRARQHDRSIVQTWAMRGTLHLIAAEDYGWLVPLVVEPRLANAFRRLREEGVPAGQPERAVRLIGQMVGREGPLTRQEIAERLSRQGIHTEGQAIAHLVWLAAVRGVVCHGPDRGREPEFVLVRDWLGEPQTREREAALGHLAVRYLTCHGPAEPADLAFWSGIPLRDANRAWRAVGDRLVAVDTDRGTRWTLHGQHDVAPRGQVRLLPAFDEYLLGWRDRDFAVAPAYWERINRGGGWLHPVALSDGRVVATWRAKAGPASPQLDTSPFEPLAPAVSRGIALEASDLARFQTAR